MIWVCVFSRNGQLGRGKGLRPAPEEPVLPAAAATGGGGGAGQGVGPGHPQPQAAHRQEAMAVRHERPPPQGLLPALRPQDRHLLQDHQGGEEGPQGPHRQALRHPRRA
uniref:Uncharacterized protein n=1 Tax=Triticum urartu TaxID=4572 RepID=A0A8R7PDQ0_TRIUA